MKNVLAILCLLALGQVTMQAQKTLRGTVEYTYTVKGDNSGMMSGMLPERMVVVYGDDAMLTYMEGGMMASMMGKIIVNGGESYIVKEDQKTIYEMSEEDINSAEEQQKEQMGKAEKVEGQTKEIKGYPCQLYEVEVNQNGQTGKQKIWVTEKLKAPEIKGSGASAMNQGLMGANNVPGFPMEVEVEIPQANMTMVLSVNEITLEKPDPAIFKKPEGFEVKPFSEMMNMMGGN